MTVVTHILGQMPAITKPQRQFVRALFAVISCLRGRVNFRNLARYSKYSERTFHRQFRREFDFAEFNRLSITQGVSPAATLVLAQDATGIPKSGKLTHGIDRFFNGCTHRVERGLEASAIAVVEVTAPTAFTLSVRQTPSRPPAANKAIRRKRKRAVSPTDTRMYFYLEHFRSGVPPCSI